MDNSSKQKNIQGIIDRVKEVRETAGFSQDEMAKKLNIERLTYAKYESRSKIPTDLLWSFCVLCRVTPEYILAGTKPDELSVLEVAFLKAPNDVQMTIKRLLGMVDMDYIQVEVGMPLSIHDGGKPAKIDFKAPVLTKGKKK